MTELETIARAQSYLEKLSRGIHPIGNGPIPEGDVVLEARISRCLAFTADVLRRVAENGGIGGGQVREKREKKRPFSMTCEQREAVSLSETPLTISELANRLNEAVADPGIRRISYAALAEWLLEAGVLEEFRSPAGAVRKRPSPEGRALGFQTELREGERGRFEVTVLDRDAQQFLLDHLDAVLERTNISYELQGKPWTPEQEGQLIDLHRNGASVTEICRAMQRNPASIRARLRRLEKRGRLDG